MLLRWLIATLCTATFIHGSCALAGDASEQFPIRHFEISGNQLFSDEQLQKLVEPFIGEARTYQDIQRAQRAVQNAYLAAGYGAVQAITPEQELSDGNIRINVVESRIAHITVVGNSHFDEANIRAGVPSLREGELPNLREISANVQLSNENPAKRIEVLLNSPGTAEELEARILVKDQNPLRISASLDNTGSQSTGRTRFGVALQHANLFNRDHVATLAYTTSPEKTDKVDIYSFSYRIPVYACGDSVDLIYGYSSVKSGSSQTVAGPLNFGGSGRVLAARYNHHFDRKGEYTSRLTLGLDQRDYLNSCSINGISCGSADADVTVHPVSVTYLGAQAGASNAIDFYGTYAHNISGGDKGHNQDFTAIRQGAEANYQLLRFGASWVHSFSHGWQSRVAFNGQYTTKPLVPGEQIGLAGSSAVRGFNEREISTDSGIFSNLELYTPNLGMHFGLDGNKSLRGLIFMDAANGHNRDATSSIQVNTATLASVGVGLRADWSNRMSFHLDLADVIHTHPSSDQNTGDIRGHFALNILF